MSSYQYFSTAEIAHTERPGHTQTKGMEGFTLTGHPNLFCPPPHPPIKFFRDYIITLFQQWVSLEECWIGAIRNGGCVKSFFFVCFFS